MNEAAQAPNKWGYWATAAWAVVAFLIGQFAALAFVAELLTGSIGFKAILMISATDKPFDGTLVTLFVVISNPITIAVLWLAARLARANPIDYLGLIWPKKRDVVVGLLLLVGLIVLSDVLLYVSGRELVTPFQLQSYTTAAAEGWLPALWIAAVIVAPAGEEILFRGFLFQGFRHSDRPILSFIDIRSVGMIICVDVLLVCFSYFFRDDVTPAIVASVVATPVLIVACDYISSRAFEFWGLGRAHFAALRAIIIISLLWAGLHIQYDWAGMLQIFIIGLFLGWVRWTSGSVLLTFFLHALFNLEGTMETVLAIRFFS